jgi:hypothetical protein
MTTHPYVRAFMAGAFVPNIIVVLGFLVFVISRYGVGAELPIERFIVFPLAIVPTVWGLWNIVYVAALSQRHFPIGVFGALLPLLLMPGGVFLARMFDLRFITFGVAALAYPVAGIAYFLFWRHAVGRLNVLLGVG